MKKRRVTAISVRSLLACLVIGAVLAGSLGIVTPGNPQTAAAVTDTALHTEAGHAYLFRDPINGTELYVNTGSGVYRFASPDGYDTGTVRAVRMFSKSNLIVINDRVKDFNFNCNVDFKENLCHGQLSDKRDHGYLPKYSISAPAAGAELPDQPIVPSTTVVLGETSLDCLSIGSGNFSTLNFTDTTRQLSSLSVGDVIVSGVSNMTPYGLLRQVTDVVFNGDQIVVETIPATLEDAIQECHVDGSWSLLPDGSAVPLGMMVSENCQSSTFSSDVNVQLDSVGGTKSMASIGSGTGWYIDIDDVVLFDADGDLGSKDDQIVASGSLCADVQFDFGLIIEDWAVEEARFLVRTTNTAELDIGLKVTIADFHEKIELYRQYLNPIVVWVAWVPVVVTPVLTFNVGIDAEASTGITASITETADVTVGLTYEAGMWSPVTDLSTSFGWEPPILAAGCEVKGYVGPQLSLLLAGVTGPYGEISGYLELDADLFETPWWKLYGGVEADVGFRVEVLGHNIADYEVPAAIGYRVLLAQAETGGPEVIDTITVEPLGDGPLCVGVNPNTNRIYVSNEYSHNVVVIDGDTHAIITAIPVGLDPHGVGVNPNTNRIYVANFNSNSVSVIDGGTNAVLTTIPVGSQPHGVGVNPSTNRIYVANQNLGSVSVIDGGTNAVVATIGVPMRPRGVAVNANTNRIYVASGESHSVSVIDGNINAVVATIDLGAGHYPVGMGVDTHLNRAYAGDYRGLLASVSVINGDTNAVVDSVAVGADPFDVEANPNTGHVYATSQTHNNVSVIDGNTNTVIATIAVGDNPLGIGVNPNTGRIYVANRWSNTISVIADIAGP